MVGVLIAPELVDGQDEHAWRETYQYYGLLTGQQDWDAYVTLIAGATINGLIVTGDLRVTGNTDVDGYLNVKGNVTLGDASSDVVNINGNATAQANLTVKGAFTADGASEFNNTATFNAALTAKGTTQIGDATADSLTVHATTTHTANVTVQTVGGTVALATDVANQRVLIGSAAASGGTAVHVLDVSGGRAYFSANGEQTAVGIKWGKATAAVYLGATNSSTPDLVFANTSGSPVGRWLNSGTLIVGTSTAAVGAERLRVDGDLNASGQIVAGATTPLRLVAPTTAAPGARTQDGFFRVNVLGNERYVPYYL